MRRRYWRDNLEVVKNLAKLALFFSLSFAIIFFAATGVRYLSLQVEWARILPQRPETFLTIIISAAHWALSLAMYTSILLSLSYTARRRYFAPMAVICVMSLSLLFNFGVSFALYHWESVPPAETNIKPMGEKGLILSSTLNRNETAVILLNGTSDPLGPRVTAIPDRPLFFQESTANAGISLPPIPFGDDSPWFIKSFTIDLRLSDEQLQGRYGEGIFFYLIYAGALVFMLCSLGLFINKFSVWPLANLFLGILAFRGILAIETFLNSPEMQDLSGSFFKNIMPDSMVVPSIFLAFGLLVNTYSILFYVAKRRNEDDN